MRSILIATLLLLSVPSYAREYPLETKEWAGAIANINAVYMTSGPEWFDEKASNEYNRQHAADTSIGKYYRVYFLVYEIYYSVLIEEMAYSGVEGSSIKSINTNFITGFEIGEKVLKMRRLTNLQFEKWDSWNSFLVKESDTLLKIRIKQNGNFSVEKLD